MTAHRDMNNKQQTSVKKMMEMYEDKIACLEEANQQLQLINEELQQFVYIASHDLKEPLRIITGFVQIFVKRYRGQLDDDAERYIDFVLEGSNRMKTMLNDLLHYSRIRTQANPRVKIDSRELLKRVIKNMKASLDAHQGEVTYGKLPVIYADETQLGQVFHHLIMNGLKFNERENKSIHVEASKDDGNWIFSVSDDGIGIDAPYCARIFEIFQRLHCQEEYSGNGFGLALCKRIIDCHNGKIWVESVPKQGSTFYFTIPDNSINVEE